MSAFGKSSIDYYTDQPERKTAIFPSADGLFCLNSADKPGSYLNDGSYNFEYKNDNNFIISNRGVILAGNFSGIKVSEVNFPYLVPNVNPRNNTFYIHIKTAPSPTISTYKITIPEGFYTAPTLKATINSTLTTVIPGTPISIDYVPEFLLFVFVSSNPNVTFAVTNEPNGVTDVSGNIIQLNQKKQSLLTLLNIPPNSIENLKDQRVGGPTTLQYSRFIDFTSDLLSQYQQMNDTSTANVNKRHIFCRLYVSTEVSMPSTDASGNAIFAGSSVPFNIYRQFKNPKTLKWNGKDSIDRIDVQVWDEHGDPFWFQGGYPGFQFTLQAVE